MYYYTDLGFRILTALELLIPLLMIVASCKIFSDCGEAWWKSLIPFYRTKVFGNIVMEPEKGTKTAIFEFLSGVSAVLLMISYIVFISDYFAEVSVTSCIGFGILMIVFGILYLINITQLRLLFLSVLDLPPVLAFLWIFAPFNFFIVVYLAFFAKIKERICNN